MILTARDVNVRDPGQLAPQPTQTLILVILSLSTGPAVKSVFRCLSALGKLVHLNRVGAFLFLSALKICVSGACT